MIGERLGPYEIVGRVGVGGMGEVYRANDTRLGRHVAVKVLPARALDSADARARFEREARAIAALNHPNICTLFDVGTDESRPYVVMELLSGASLHEVLAAGPLPPGVLVDHAIALADALHAAHSRRIVHRDLKPANVFVTEHGTVKILDFGLARADRDVAWDGSTIDTAVTAPGVTLGTPSYMSPEQLRGDPVDARSDLFSLGLLLYEMATGRRAFTGRTFAEVSAAILSATPPPPASVRADLPPAFGAIILKAIEKDRDLRYQSAADLRADLKRLRREENRGASPPTVTPSAPSSSPPSGSDAAIAVGLLRRHLLPSRVSPSRSSSLRGLRGGRSRGRDQRPSRSRRRSRCNQLPSMDRPVIRASAAMPAYRVTAGSLSTCGATATTRASSSSN
jgi:serine/threonine protein kinase